MLAEPNSRGLIATLADVTIDRSGESAVIPYQGLTTGFPQSSSRDLLKCDLGTSPIVGLEISGLNTSDAVRHVGRLRGQVSMRTEQQNEHALHLAPPGGQQGQSPDDPRFCPE